MFIVVSGGDFATSKRYKGVRPSSEPPDGIEAAILKGRIAQLENAREANPADATVLEEEAVTYAQLFEFEKAADLLDKLVAVRPRDSEAWRLLGETTLLSQQAPRSVAAYEKAVALATDDLQVITGPPRFETPRRCPQVQSPSPGRKLTYSLYNPDPSPGERSCRCSPGSPTPTSPTRSPQRP